MTLKYLMWVLGTELLSSRRAIRALNYAIIYLATSFYFIEMETDMKVLHIHVRGEESLGKMLAVQY